ncbi:hypothetical protein MXB_99, partial [Myxobolus squamalis]
CSVIFYLNLSQNAMLKYLSRSEIEYLRLSQSQKRFNEKLYVMNKYYGVAWNKIDMINDASGKPLYNLNLVSRRNL